MSSGLSFSEFLANRDCFEMWARGRDLNLEPMVHGGLFCGYVVPYVDAIYEGFIAGVSYSNFEAATGLTKEPNAGVKL